MKLIKASSDLSIKLTISKKVFQPTSTTNIIVDCCLKKIKNPSTILDLGCGSGIIGLSLFKKGKTVNPIYFSDISKQSIKDVNKNAKYHNACIDARCGYLFEPWENYKFDYIINDVAGISEDVAKISKWYKSVSCLSGKDGTKLVNNQCFTDGGRVLNVVGMHTSLDRAISKAYEVSKLIDYDGKFYRTDIGKKAFKHLHKDKYL